MGSLVHFFMYFTFGSIIAPWILSYYDSPSQSLGLTVPPFEVMIPLEILRGFLYVVALLPIIATLRVSSRTMLLSVVGLLYFAGAFVPFLTSSTLPTFLRIVYRLEIPVDSIVYGAALVHILKNG